MSRNTESCLTNDLPSSGHRSYEQSRAKTERERRVHLPRSLSQVLEAGHEASSICSATKVIFVRKMDHCRRRSSVNTDSPWWFMHDYISLCPAEICKKNTSQVQVWDKWVSRAHTSNRLSTELFSKMKQFIAFVLLGICWQVGKISSSNLILRAELIPRHGFCIIGWFLPSHLCYMSDYGKKLNRNEEGLCEAT